MFKRDGVGPVNNRPSIDLLNHFVKKNGTCDMWHMTCDMWHVIHDMWHVVGGEHFLNKSPPYLLGFGKDSVLKIGRQRITDKLNYEGVYRTGSVKKFDRNG